MRPFTAREVDEGMTCIVDMHDTQTVLFNPAGHSADGPDHKVCSCFLLCVVLCFVLCFFFFFSSFFLTYLFVISRQKVFTFDRSFWSFSSDDAHFVNQQTMFQELGMDVLDNSFAGYNACIFAYGQTGFLSVFLSLFFPSSFWSLVR